jgi:transcriptional regulator with XRE-family HTH domain
MAYYWNKDGNVMDREIRRKESVAFFTNLRFLSERNGLSNKELANVLDIHPTYIPKYLSGKTVPREETFEEMKRLATDFFDVSVSDLLDGDFKDDYVEPEKEIVVAEPEKDEDRIESTVPNEIVAAINKRKARVAQLSKEIAELNNEIESLELAHTLITADKLA